MKKEVREEFYEKFTTLVKNVSNQKEVILLGDFNTRTGKKVREHIVNQYREDIEKGNGEHLIKFFQTNGLKNTKWLL